MSIHTKWPRLLVVGEPVTEDQADQILIRTNCWWHLGGNDKDWEKSVRGVAAEFGYPPESDWKALDDWCRKMGVLNLEYLGNSRIMSSYIGGPHGWCDWSGRIGCDSYNIGKWPSERDVTGEWGDIAAAFPFLDLTAQCVDEEGAGEVAGEWRVQHGNVTYNPEPAGMLTRPTDDTATRVANLFTFGRERGVSIDRFRRALSTVARAGAGVTAEFDATKETTL